MPLFYRRVAYQQGVAKSREEHGRKGTEFDRQYIRVLFSTTDKDRRGIAFIPSKREKKKCTKIKNKKKKKKKGRRKEKKKKRLRRTVAVQHPLPAALRKAGQSPSKRHSLFTIKNQPWSRIIDCGNNTILDLILEKKKKKKPVA